LLPIISYAQDQHDALVQELYLKSGLEKQIEQVPLLIQASFNRTAPGDERVQQLPKNLAAAMKASVQEAFAPQSLKKAMLQELREKLTVQEIKEVLAWFDSPLGKNCTRLEEAASTPEALAEMEQYAARIKNSPPTAERLDVLRKLDVATKSTESAVDLAINSQVAVALAINATLPLQQQRPLKDIARELEESRPQFEAEVRSEMVIIALYTYQSLTEAQIRQYIKFATSPAGSKLSSVVNNAFKKAFLDGCIKWGKAIGEAKEQLEKQSDS
jgi:hypothetical protein